MHLVPPHWIELNLPCSPLTSESTALRGLICVNDTGSGSAEWTNELQTMRVFSFFSFPLSFLFLFSPKVLRGQPKLALNSQSYCLSKAEISASKSDSISIFKPFIPRQDGMLRFPECPLIMASQGRPPDPDISAAHTKLTGIPYPGPQAAACSSFKQEQGRAISNIFLAHGCF